MLRLREVVAAFKDEDTAGEGMGRMSRDGRRGRGVGIRLRLSDAWGLLRIRKVTD